MELLTASRGKDARACQRLHKYRYVDGYRPAIEAETLRFGSLWHAGLESWWLAPQAERLERALAAVSPKAADAFDLAKVNTLLRGYHCRWAGEPLEAISVETPFECELRNPETGAASRTFRLAGKVDGIIRDAVTGRVQLMECKTTSDEIDAGSEYWKRLRIDSQVSIYYDGAAALGHKVESCLYDVVRKPTLRPLKATPVEQRKYTKPTKKNPESRIYAGQRDTDETPEEYGARLAEDIAANPARYYSRGEVVRLDAELEEARFDLWQIAQQLRESQRLGRFPRNPDACMRYGRTCDFWPVCVGEASLDDPSKYVRLQDPHPELSAAAA